MSGIDWDEIERQQRGKPRTYTTRMCPYCSRVISEGAWGRRDSNWKKHATACEKRRATENDNK